jgi:hypothetical protein
MTVELGGLNPIDANRYMPLSGFRPEFTPVRRYGAGMTGSELPLSPSLIKREKPALTP